MPKPTFKTHKKAHRTIVKNASLYGETTLLKEQFDVAQTAKRQAKVIEILSRARRSATRQKDTPLAAALNALVSKLRKCETNKRCASLACPECARAAQIAKTRAHRRLIKKEKAGKREDLVFITIIPDGMMFTTTEFPDIDVSNANRWLKDQLRKAKINSPVVGSLDLGWEDRRRKNKSYLQVHWHLTVWCDDIRQLRKDLKKLFPSARKHEKAVKVTHVKKLRCIVYTHKTIKLAKLLRESRKVMPDLLLLLDRIEPLQPLLLMRFRLSVKGKNLKLKAMK